MIVKFVEPSVGIVASDIALLAAISVQTETRWKPSIAVTPAQCSRSPTDV
jgi:hypothetical protein